MTGPLLLSNLGAWIAQSTLVIAASLLTLRILRPDPPAIRYGLLRVVLAVSLVLPLVQPHRDAREQGAARATTGAVAAASGGAGGLGAGEVPRWIRAGAWPGIVAVVLAAGILVRLVWIVAGILRLRRLRAAGAPAGPGRDHEDLQALIGARAAIRYVAGLGQPVTFGFRRPVILLPASLDRQPPAIQRAVAAHELWHVRRRDWLWTVVEELIRASCWYHPAIWILVSKLQFAREELVDELAILATGSRRSYLDALLAFADDPPLPAATAFARRRHLAHRMVLISKEGVMSARRVVACCAVCAVVVFGTGYYAAGAFPLVQAGIASEVAAALQGPGPLERQARPVTPENPVPRRTYSVPADPTPEADAVGAHGVVTMRLTLDGAGQIAESRIVALRLNLGGRGTINYTNMTADSLTASVTGTMRLAADEPPVSIRPLVESTLASALRAVRHWQYAAPAEAPLSFNVTVPVGAPPPPPPPPPSPAGSPRAGTAPPPPPPAPWNAAEGALRVGGTIKPPTKIRHVNPMYPPDARDAKVQGVVILETRIEPDGRVGDVRVLRSVPMLDQAAMDAVRQWEFTPTLMNGEPVPIIMTVTVNFTLAP